MLRVPTPFREPRGKSRRIHKCCWLEHGMNTNNSLHTAALRAQCGIRPSVRKALSLRKPAGVFVGVCALAQSMCLVAHAANTIPWPSEGVFPAYPEEPEHGVQPYLIGTGVIDDNLFRQ